MPNRAKPDMPAMNEYLIMQILGDRWMMVTEVWEVYNKVSKWAGRDIQKGQISTQLGRMQEAGLVQSKNEAKRAARVRRGGSRVFYRLTSLAKRRNGKMQDMFWSASCERTRSDY